MHCHEFSCLYYLWDVRPYALSWVFLFSGPFVEVLSLSTSRMAPEYLTRETAQVFILLLRLLLYDRFLVLLGYSLLIFFLSSLLILCCPLPIFPSTCKFPFFRTFWFFVDFSSSIHSVICIFPLLIISVAHFSIENSIRIFLTVYIHCLY